MKKVWQKIDKNYIWITCITILMFLPFLIFYVNGHDSLYHISNVYALSSNFNIFHLFDYKIFPVIAKGFGYGSGIFYPQLSHICAVLFHSIGKYFSLETISSLKFVHILAFWLSGIFMYRFIKETVKDNQIAFLASLFYMTMPYHIIETYIRDAFAEILIFSFLPIVMLGLHYLFQKDWKRFYFYFIIGYVGLIESHLVLTVYITIFLGLALLLLYKKFFQKDIFLRFCLATFIVTCINLPFLVPMIEHKVLGNYAVFHEGFMTSLDKIIWQTVRLRSFVNYRFREYDKLLFSILTPCFILIAFLCIKYKKIKSKESDWLIKTSFLFAGLSFLMCTIYFPWKYLPSFLWMIQFPWRLETILCFGVSILAAFSLKIWKPQTRKKIVIICLIFCALSTCYILIKSSYVKIDINEINISEKGVGEKEYFPYKTIENFEYYENRSQDVLVKEGSGEVTLIKNEFPKLQFKVSDASTLELPRLYYLGYEVKAKTNDKEYNIPYYENEYGFIEIKVEEESEIEVDYKGTKLGNISKIISILTVILYIAYFPITSWQEKRKLK